VRFVTPSRVARLTTIVQLRSSAPQRVHHLVLRPEPLLKKVLHPFEITDDDALALQRMSGMTKIPSLCSARTRSASGVVGPFVSLGDDPAAGRTPSCHRTNRLGSRRAMRPSQCIDARSRRLNRLNFRCTHRAAAQALGKFAADHPLNRAGRKHVAGLLQERARINRDSVDHAASEPDLRACSTRPFR
jgi:hypothetical protein